MIKTFFFVEVIAVLALIRAIVGKGASRLAALASFALAIVAIAAKYGPPLAGLVGTEIGRIADLITKAGVLNSGSGMAMPIAVSLLFALSAFVTGRRWWALDALHALAALGFFGLWIYTSL